jgi:ATP-dependent DNA helicase RecG
LVEGDIFRIIVKCPDFEARQTDPTELRPESGVQVTPTVTPTVRALLELLHKTGESGSTEIRKAFELKDRVHVHKSYLQPALKSGYIEMTIPDKPNSRLQKYRLTDEGKRLMKSMHK